ncbi:response regulator [Piscinibacter koreensis]|uniref:Response regulator n=1 Tax=Piscinibacter koreensis TaxID=2742824 RepID=A0A7Y6NR47_9BURK|nr:response regulator [Schlegelella koreensis]
MSPASPLRVLVVDDNVDAAQSLCFLLEAMGCEAAACHDGPAGLGLASRFEPHLAIIDLDMPRMRGCDVVRHLRLQDGHALAMVVCLTGSNRAEDRQQSLAAGFDAYVLKPIDHATLAGVLERARALTVDLRTAHQPRRRATPARREPASRHRDSAPGALR